MLSLSGQSGWIKPHLYMSNCSYTITISKLGHHKILHIENDLWWLLLIILLLNILFMALFQLVFHLFEKCHSHHGQTYKYFITFSCQSRSCSHHHLYVESVNCDTRLIYTFIWVFLNTGMLSYMSRTWDILHMILVHIHRAYTKWTIAAYLQEHPHRDPRGRASGWLPTVWECHVLKYWVSYIW